jgi:hypothetical protein
MADLAQLERALRNADAAGDDQAARTLAQAIRAQRQEPAADKRLPAERMMQNAVAGGVRGAGSIGATLLAPFDMATDAIERAVTGKDRPVSRNAARRQGMDQALTGLMGADPTSLAFQLPKVGMEVAGTLGVGPAVAGLGAAVPAIAARAAPVLDAVRTAGMSAGGLTGARALAARSAGGGIAGAAAAGVVNPEDAVLGGIVGGALPGVAQVAGKAGQAAGAGWRSLTAGREEKAGSEIARALGLETPEQVAAAVRQLERARELVPGAGVTAAQALRTPQASIVERVVSESAGGVGLKNRMAAQNAARLAALDRVAPTNPLGLGSAKNEFGEALGDFTLKTDRGMRVATRAAYEQIPQDEAMLYLPDLAAVRDSKFPAGSIVDRANVDSVVNMADQIGLSRAPGVPQSYKPQRAEKLSEAIRKAGGLNLGNNSGLEGELRGIKGDFKNLVRNQSGLSPARMAEKLYEAGFLPDEQASTLVNALRDEAGGASVVSVRDQAFRLPGGGDGPAAQPVKVTLRQLETLRQDIGEMSRNAAPQSREKLTLDEMRRALDSRIDEVVRGDGLPDENLPIDWADKLTAARQAKVDQVKTTGTGPQSFAFRKGQDGLPMYQGRELADKAWRQGVPPGDVQQLRVLIDKNPKLLGQFRSLITSEGAATTTQGGNLTGKFAKWVDNSLPGLKASFDPKEVEALRRIALDIKRAERAVAVGAAKGSPTYQNANNALDMGLLDSRLADWAALKVPVGGQALQWFRESGRAQKAGRMAGVLGDSSATANALTAANRPVNALALDPEIQRLLYRSAPVLSGDR